MADLAVFISKSCFFWLLDRTSFQLFRGPQHALPGFAGCVAGLIFTVSLALIFGTVIHFSEAVALATHAPMDAFGQAAFSLIVLAMSAKNILISVLGVRAALGFGASSI